MHCVPIIMHCHNFAITSFSITFNLHYMDKNTAFSVKDHVLMTKESYVILGSKTLLHSFVVCVQFSYL